MEYRTDSLAANKMPTSLDERLAGILPSKRQLDFQSTEFYAFIHFSVNAFTDKEWGDGTESPDIFDPNELDADQWVRAVVSAGMRGLILTCKHHDGICLWNTKLTSHGVMNSPYGKDIVEQVAKACKKYGIKFGIYLSPWDRHEPTYGTGKPYDDHFVGQLTELLTGYGDIFCVWLDGACGEGKNGRKQLYDWERYYETVRRLQPDACINVCGPDIRWCGNEAGQTRPCEWSVVPNRMRDTERIASLSQQEDGESFRQRRLSASDMDLGSREMLRDEIELIWYPAEVNTSIRPGWFYHSSEDGKVRSADELFDIYCNSVGGNATFLLNIPPMPNGLINQNDVQVLSELGKKISALFSNEIASAANISGCSFELVFAKPSQIKCVVLQEDISKGQRVEAFRIKSGGEVVYSGKVIGYKKIVRFDSLRTDKLTVEIIDSRTEPHILFAAAYS